MKTTVTISDHARMTIDAIARDGESDAATIRRILETLAPIAEDFDHFFGEPTDGKGPSGRAHHNAPRGCVGRNGRKTKLVALVYHGWRSNERQGNHGTCQHARLRYGRRARQRGEK